LLTLILGIGGDFHVRGEARDDGVLPL